MRIRDRGLRFRGWLTSAAVGTLYRVFLVFITAIALITSITAAARAADYPDVIPGRALTFPADEGSHPAFRTEWWYITGWLNDEKNRPLGFQVTFFRSRPGIDEDNPSRFAPKQLVFAHAALSDPEHGELRRAERSARAGFGLAEAAEERLDVHIDDWSLRKEGEHYRARIVTDEMTFDLTFEMSQVPLLQGREGFSQKGPDPLSSSYYYSLPHLQVSGRIKVEGQERRVTGSAWFDHEWSSSIMDEAADGWDWVGLNLDDGSAVMAFQMRSDAGTKHWAAATWRSSGAAAQTFTPDQIEWTALRKWRSSRTGVEYPIEWRITIGSRALTLKPLMDDQENDARGSTGTLYWEGAVRVFDESGKEIGRGYLELTGYGDRAEVRM